MPLLRRAALAALLFIMLLRPSVAEARDALDGRVFAITVEQPGKPAEHDELSFAAGHVTSTSSKAGGRYLLGADGSFAAKLRGATSATGGNLQGTVAKGGKSLEATLARGATTLTLHGRLLTLFERLGGMASIDGIVGDFIASMERDPVISANVHIIAFRQGMRASSLRGHFVAFVARAAGGDVMYEGRSMRDSHAHLHLTRAEFDAGLRDLEGVLEQRKVPRREREELVVLFDSTRGDVVAE